MRMGPDVRAHFYRADPERGGDAYAVLQEHLSANTRLWLAGEPDAFLVTGTRVTGLLVPDGPITVLDAIKLKTSARRRMTGFDDLRVLMMDEDETVEQAMREVAADCAASGGRLVWPRGAVHLMAFSEGRFTAYTLHNHVEKPSVESPAFAAWDAHVFVEVPAMVRGLRTSGRPA